MTIEVKFEPVKKTTPKQPSLMSLHTPFVVRDAVTGLFCVMVRTDYEFLFIEQVGIQSVSKTKAGWIDIQFEVVDQKAEVKISIN